MKVLVIGGTGTVGSAVVDALLGRGADVRAMTRSPGARSGPEYMAGDLAAPETLGSAFADVQKVYLLTPQAENETELGLAGVAAANEAGVRHLVFQSIYQVERGPHIPHFRTKIEILEGIEASGIPYTVLAPNNFFQNDLWLKDAILNGFYPNPVGGVGTSRVDVRDIGEVAATVLLEEGHEGKTYALAGPDVLTGEECAGVWSRHVGRDVRYGGDDLEAWAEGARSMMPDWMVGDLVVMFEHFQRHGLIASDDELRELEGVLGRGPRRFEDFVAEVAPTWLD